MGEITKLQFNADLGGFQGTSNIPAFVEATRPETLQEVLSTDLQGKTCFLYTARERLRLTLQYYKAQKLTAAETTRAVVLVPATDLTSLKSELQGWELVSTLKRRSYSVVKHWANMHSAEVQGGMDLYVFKSWMGCKHYPRQM